MMMVMMALGAKLGRQEVKMIRSNQSFSIIRVKMRGQKPQKKKNKKRKKKKLKAKKKSEITSED